MSVATLCRVPKGDLKYQKRNVYPHSAEVLTRKGIFGKVRKEQVGKHGLEVAECGLLTAYPGHFFLSKE
jgi:hypothetical protein